MYCSALGFAAICLRNLFLRKAISRRGEDPFSLAAGRGDELCRQGSGFVTIAVPRATQASLFVIRDGTLAILGNATSSAVPIVGSKIHSVPGAGMWPCSYGRGHGSQRCVQLAQEPRWAPGAAPCPAAAGRHGGGRLGGGFVHAAVRVFVFLVAGLGATRHAVEPVGGVGTAGVLVTPVPSGAVTTLRGAGASWAWLPTLGRTRPPAVQTLCLDHKPQV